MISVWVMKSPRFSFVQKPPCSPSSSSGSRVSGASSRMSFFLGSSAMAGPIIALPREQFLPELLDGQGHGLPGVGDHGGVALDERQMVALGQGDDVDVEGLLLDVDHPRLAQVVAVS